MSDSNDVSNSTSSTSDHKTPRHRPHWLKSIIFTTLFFAISFVALKSYLKKYENSQKAANEIEEIQKNASRPLIKNVKFFDNKGKMIALESLQGKVVIVAFWASWCDPCLTELPTLKTPYESLKTKGLKIVAINLEPKGAGQKAAKAFWKKAEMPFGTYFDPEMLAPLQFDVDSLPATFVLDRKGRLVFSAFGANDWSNPRTFELLEGLLAE